MKYIKKIFKIIEKITIFFILVALLLDTSLPMFFYSYNKHIFFDNKVLILLYILMVIVFIFLTKKIDGIMDRKKDDWIGERRIIDKNFVGIIILFVFLLWIFNLTEGFLVEKFNLHLPLNQVVIEKELENFPVKLWFYFHVVIVGPLLEELVFRKAFMDLFFRKNNFVNNFLAVVFSGIIFGILHEPKLSWFLLFYSIPGFLLAFSYRFYKDIKIPIVVHIINNLTFLIISFLV